MQARRVEGPLPVKRLGGVLFAGKPVQVPSGTVAVVLSRPPRL